MGNEHRYNGWTNYETWCVALWMDSEEGTQEYFREMAEGYGAQSEEGSVSRFADALKDHHEELLPDLQGFVADLLNAAMSEVNWYEIAGNLMTEIENETV